MTTQQSDIIINEHPRVDLRNLDLYFILRGDIRGEHEHLELPIPPDIPDNNLTCSALWRGYVATFRLANDGTLELVSYDFPYAEPPAPTQRVADGTLKGDYWLMMRQFFFGPNTNIPFHDGRIVENRSDWDIEDQTLSGRIVRRFKDSGLLVDIDWLGHCFMPRALIPSDLATDLDALIGWSITCDIDHTDRKRNVVIVRPIEFLHPEPNTK